MEDEEDAVSELVALSSLVQSDASAEVLQQSVEALSNRTLVEALESPFQTLQVLIGAKIDTQQDDFGLYNALHHSRLEAEAMTDGSESACIERIAALCGDNDFARDLLYSSGGDVELALQMLQQQQSSSTKTKRELDLDQLSVLCNGNREFAESLLESAGGNVEMAKQLLQ